MLRADTLKVDPLPPLSFSVAKGECLAVEGPSGCGKTRLLRAIADLDRAKGQIYLNGAERNEMPAHEWRRQVRYVSPDAGWWSETARGAFPREASGMSEKVSRILAALGLDPKAIDRPLASLARGERQRLALARAFVDDPAVLLLDQPTIGLDAQSSALVDELIRFQILAGRIVLLAGHDRAQLERLAHARLQLARPIAHRGPVAP